MNDAPYMLACTPAERTYSAWLRIARERQRSAAALGRALEEQLRKQHGITPDVDLKEHGISRELPARAIVRWEKGTPGKQCPQIPSDLRLREALAVVVTALVPGPPLETEWASLHQVCEALAAERLERVKTSL